jgi:hypothetical protein
MGETMRRRGFLRFVPVILLAGLPVLSSCSNRIDALRSAAERGDPSAQLTLGTAYAKGEGVSLDYAEAAKWVRRAAEQGHPEARFNLGVAYSNGLGVPRDPEEAARWFRLAAEQGHPGAQNNLGASYSHGLGVPRDDAEAAKWYRKAAEQGHPHAQAHLAFAYEKGRGVPRDDLQAYLWFSLAAEKSAGKTHDALTKSRDAAKKKLSPVQLAEAQRLILMMDADRDRRTRSKR